MAFRFTLLLLFTMHGALCAEEMLRAANQTASPINQRRAFGNACGPASLLNAFQYGTDRWQRVFNAIPGHNSNTRIRHLVSTWGEQPSKHIDSVQRWNKDQGINLVDLHDIANEMCGAHHLPEVKYQILTRKKSESRANLLKRTHKLITTSLNEGLPPILSIRRYAFRESKELASKSWWPIRAHFIVVIAVTKNIGEESESFNIKYVDPYGGFTREGKLQTDTGKFTESPFLGAGLPAALVGKSLIKKGEDSVLTCSAVMGHW